MTTSTEKFRKRPDKFSKEEYDLQVKSNFLEFLQQIDVISIETWDEVAGPIEDKLVDFVIKRGGLFKGKL